MPSIRRHCATDDDDDDDNDDAICILGSRNFLTVSRISKKKVWFALSVMKTRQNTDPVL